MGTGHRKGSVSMETGQFGDGTLGAYLNKDNKKPASVMVLSRAILQLPVSDKNGDSRRASRGGKGSSVSLVTACVSTWSSHFLPGLALLPLPDYILNKVKTKP